MFGRSQTCLSAYLALGAFEFVLAGSAASSAQASLPTTRAEAAPPPAASHPAFAKGFHILHAFDAFFGGLGEQPAGGVIFDARGNMFGTTALGGAAQRGTVFELQPSANGYAAKLLHSFSCSVDGCEPQAGPALDPVSGDLFVTADEGGYMTGLGSLIKLVPSTTGFSESNVYFYAEQTTGSQPFATPLLVGSTVYTTTADGGATFYGTVVASAAADLSPTVLYSFPGYAGDGEGPLAGLVSDATGALYGTTTDGGTSGAGTVYRIVPSASGASESVLWSFNAGSDGARPFGAVVFDGAGNIYGATAYGGTANLGSVYKLTPNGAHYRETILHTFTGADGANPAGNLALDGTTLWGATSAGGNGPCACGTLFSLETSGQHFRVRHVFAGTDGSQPYGGLTAHGHALYGTTFAGGPSTGDEGVVFQFVP
jgi:uncharacterized repeat protein (TIGR03803 family)